ncbi:Uncharacterised protein [Plesiomonas shigelloides]|uniref:hypothetical protein n=1 Tax=Plesiomonas shigelloides TaxID=703 RepID=UPI000E047679|nr:hypothetical protein [Plesiomonas shigelloides]SUB64942.1 Uncharacterised protein [Plesiomonas shigelloides]
MQHDNKKNNAENLQEQHRNNANVKASEGDEVKSGHHNNFLAEAVAGGVQVTCNGSVLPLMPYKDALNRLESGRYDSLDFRRDDRLDYGVRIARALTQGLGAGYWSCSVYNIMAIMRYLAAASFTFEMIKQNGLISDVWNGNQELVTRYMNAQASIAVHPFATRLGLAAHLEPVMIEQFGADEWEFEGVEFYSRLIGDEDQPLSVFGRDVFAKLYDSLIQTLEEDGLPAAPVIH